MYELRIKRDIKISNTSFPSLIFRIAFHVINSITYSLQCQNNIHYFVYNLLFDETQNAYLYLTKFNQTGQVYDL